MTNTFKANKNYTFTYYGDMNDCVVEIKVIKRTAKTITFIYQGEEMRRNIKFDECDNSEYVQIATYTGASLFRASKVA